MLTRIVYEDEHLLVVLKPAGIAVQTGEIGRGDVVSELKNYLAKKAGTSAKPQTGKPAKAQSGKPTAKAQPAQPPYLGVIHRLDQPVEGLLVFAKTRRAAADLSAALQNNTGDASLHKDYLAVVAGELKGQGTLTDMMAKRGNAAVILPEESTDARPAVLHYRSLAYLPDAGITLLQVSIETGRFHQIRAQLSHAGHPILGDRKYGNADSLALSDTLRVRNTALCAHTLRLMHPITGREMHFEEKPANPVFSLFDGKSADA